MVGRIEVYTHSDSVTPNKGGAIVKVESQTDFAARTVPFIAFTQDVAKYAFAADSEFWLDIIEQFPHLELEWKVLEETLREKVSVTEIKILKL